MAEHVLFQLNPWMENSEGPFYCPDCGIVEGFFRYAPDVETKIRVVRVDFQRPRKPVVELLGEENQGCPVLVLDDTQPERPPQAKKSMSTGRWFIDDPKAICDYLGRVFGTVRPHP